ncbi:replication protein A 14 kDa subunit-like [Frieseomelitta varia]|uniref:replication protein A 14 kDa subunit-like n=1 Tax=Frieseomelitta varia TaxID=561572 RepID=UPI001CB6A256|nr:replication protein A 14 kDa subunit-like [Frieseomelitta varia]XP_043522224.1 replication protein A 14 kDa subunit-like [Frieseomelitta varia]
MIKKRIDGRRLGQNIGNQVILLGTIGKKSSNGKNLELRTTDGVQVNVTLPEPIDSEAEGYIEVHGTLQSSTTMNCSNYVVFPLSMTEDFDADQYSQLLVILNVLGPGKWKMSEDSKGF